MSLDIHGKNVKLWKNEHETKSGNRFVTYSVSVPKKQDDGTYKYKSMKLAHLRSVVIPDEIPNGALCDFDGYLTLDVYKGRDGEVANLMVMATQIVFHDYDADNDGYQEVDEELPF